LVEFTVFSPFAGHASHLFVLESIRRSSPVKALAVTLLAGLFAVPAFADLIVSRGTLGVDRYSNSGAFLGNFIPPGTGGLSDARGVGVSPAGDIYVADFSNDNVLRFNGTGAFQGVFASGADVDTPLGIAFGTGGDLFVESAGAVSNVARVDKTTGAVLNASFTSGNATPLGGPQFLTFGPDLAVTDIAGHLFRFDAVSGVSTFTGLFDNPQGVAFDAAGDLFFAQRISDNIRKIPAGGGPAAEVIPNGAFAGSPADLAIGPDGLLYIASSSAIYRFDVSGANGVLVDSFGSGGRYLAFTSTVPEPATALLACMGVGMLFALARRRS
jgi:hypothetical protein